MHPLHGTRDSKQQQFMLKKWLNTVEELQNMEEKEELQNMHGLNQTQSATLAHPLLSTQQSHKLPENTVFTDRDVHPQHS